MTTTHTISFTTEVGGIAHYIEAEYSEIARRLTIRGRAADAQGLPTKLVEVDWFDWTDDFLNDAKFQALVEEQLKPENLWMWN